MAMPNNAKVFPRGYSGGQSFTAVNHSVRAGDSEVTALYRDYTKGDENTSHTWAFRRRAIKLAKRILTGTPNWFIDQDKNPYVMAYNYEFLLDTLRFIATGYRRIAIHAWPALLGHCPEQGLRDVQSRRGVANAFIELSLTYSIEELLQRWLSHPRGFDDMVCTLNLLFGDIPVKIPHPEITKE